MHDYEDQDLFLLSHFSPAFFCQETLSSATPNYVFQPVDSSDSMKNCSLLTVMPCNDTGDPLQLGAWVLLHLCSSMHHGVETGPHHHCTSAGHITEMYLLYKCHFLAEQYR